MGIFRSALEGTGRHLASEIASVLTTADPNAVFHTKFEDNKV
jgi:hypothetical protein